MKRLRFIQRVNDLGFSLAEVNGLLDLRVDDEATCEDVQAETEAKIEEVEEKIRGLQHIRDALTRLAEACSEGFAVVAGRLHQMGASQAVEFVITVLGVAIGLHRTFGPLGVT